MNLFDKFDQESVKEMEKKFHQKVVLALVDAGVMAKKDAKWAEAIVLEYVGRRVTVETTIFAGVMCALAGLVVGLCIR